MDAVGKWVLEGTTTRIRQMAAQAITNPDQLAELVRATRGGNDKTVYRILSTKRTELHEQARLLQQRQAEIDETVAAIVRRRELPYDALADAGLDYLEARWRTLEPHAAPDVQSTIEQHLRDLRDAYARARQEAEAEAERKRAAARAAEEARRQQEIEAQARVAAAAEQARLIEAEREAKRAAEQARRDAEAAEVHSLVSLLRQSQAALDHGGTARAARLRESLAEKLQQSPALPLPTWFARKLEEFDTRLAELSDWKTFTVVPKRDELLKQMQALIGADLSPEELAQRIRRLRDAWRTLHRGAGDDPAAEFQQQFDEAADRAYAPCREHFAKQAEIRHENQARREALLERLASFAAEQAGEQFDWRAVSRALGYARREWREHAPVDPAVVKPLQARFHAIVDELQKRLDVGFASNGEAKRELIARAAGLPALADTRQAIAEAKALQQEWKAVGPAPRNQDRALWDEFRQHCDAIFQRSAQEHAARGAALDTNQARAATLCEELEQMLEAGDASPASVTPRLDELRAEFDALELPRGSARELRQRFARAIERYQGAQHRQRTSAARQHWIDVFAAAARIREYALAVVQQRAADECEALRASAEAEMTRLTRAPKEVRGLLERQLSRVAAGEVDADLGANAAAFRRLCIRAELIAGLETPPEDQPLRHEYQMQRLVASMQRGERITPAELEGLALEWISVGPADPAVHDALFERFQRCREAGARRN
jgi:hypothetical protein